MGESTMKRLNYDTIRHKQALNVQRKLIGLYESLTMEFLDVELEKMPFQGIHRLRAVLTLEKLEGFYETHRGDINTIAEMMNKPPSIETLQNIIDKVNVHTHTLEGETFIQLDYSKQVGRWWNLLTENSRGNIFRYPNLELVSLPFGKFYNLNERSHTELKTLNLNQNSYVMEKLDGTMIHLFESNGILISATRGSAGVYYFNDKVIELIQQANQETILAVIRGGYTPIFEILLKPEDEFGQIVKYEKEEIRLIAVRHRETGEYVHPTVLEEMAIAFGVKSAIFYQGKELFHVLQEQNSIVNMEGWVIYFEDGLMVKVKGEEYVAQVRSENLKEKVKNKMEKQENEIGKTIYGWMQAGIIDDQLSFIQSDDLRNELNQVMDEIEKALVGFREELKDLFNRHYSDDRKTFAMALKNDKTIDRSTFSLLFELYKGSLVDAESVKWETLEKYMEKAPAI